MRFLCMFGLIWFMVIVAGAIGWCMNIATIISSISDPITGMFIVRCFGVVAFPLGAILGYF